MVHFYQGNYKDLSHIYPTATENGYLTMQYKYLPNNVSHNNVSITNSS